VEPIPPPEGATLCGGDTGEPGYHGFGKLGLTPRAERVSTRCPAVPFGTAARQDPNSAKGLDRGSALYDPVRTLILPRPSLSPIGGCAGRRCGPKTTWNRRSRDWRIHHGNSANPDYLHNSAAALALEPAPCCPRTRTTTTADHARAEGDREERGGGARQGLVLGHAGGQRLRAGCGSCHFHAGVDNRVKGQINSNTQGGDLTSITVANTLNGTADGANAEVTVDSFPLHKLADPSTPADPKN
jgi:hypothetical protein